MNDNPDEVWKDIDDFPYHQISNLGRVRTLPGGRIGYRTVTEIEIKEPTYDMSIGYMTIGRRKNGGYKKCYIHHLVLNAFVGPCPPGQECRHLNGNRTDNRWPENLKWGTHTENMDDRNRHGTSNHGERNGQSKLTQSIVDTIRNRQSESQVKLAKEFNVDQSLISRIWSREIWNTYSREEK